MLYVFDLDGTLIRGFLIEKTCDECGGSGNDAVRDQKIGCGECKGRGYRLVTRPEGYGEVVVLPGRREKLAELRAEGHAIAVATNQAGPAFGWQTREEVNSKMCRAWMELGLYEDGPKTSIHIALNHPHATEPAFRRDDGLRKPAPGMLYEAMIQHEVGETDTHFTGDLPVDREAAARAGVDFSWAHEFFGVEDPDGLERFAVDQPT